MQAWHRSQRLFELIVVLGFLGLSPAIASTGCSGDEPLVTGYASSNTPVVAPSPFGEWRLPISSQDPDVMTYARVQVDLMRGPDGHGAFLLMNFSFPDPQPWGLPFSFESAEFTWESHGKRHSARIDWSEDCTEPGKSMFPGDSWSALLELSESSADLVFEHPVFRVWGSRN